MDYEKAYKKALERAKKLQETCDSQAVVGWCEYIFPELCESEDERVRKGLIKAVSGTLEGNKLFGTDVTREEALAWLEKQANHANFCNKIQIGDKVTRNRDGVLVNLSQLNRVAKKDEKQGKSYTKKDVDDAFVEGMALAKNELEKQGEKKSSDEVLKIRQELYQSGYNDGYKHGCEDTKKQGEQKSAEWGEEDYAMIEAAINLAHEYGRHGLWVWLKSLKERYTRKPNLAQLNALSIVSKGNAPDDIEAIVSLYNDLKKLKGE